MNEQTIFAFFNDLHINLNVVIEKRENFDAMTDRETISVQDIDFLDVAIDENSEKFSQKNVFFERSRTISDTNIEKNMNFDEKNEKVIDRDDVKSFDSKKNETTNSTNC